MKYEVKYVAFIRHMWIKFLEPCASVRLKDIPEVKDYNVDGLIITDMHTAIFHIDIDMPYIELEYSNIDSILTDSNKRIIHLVKTRIKSIYGSEKSKFFGGKQPLPICNYIPFHENIEEESKKYLWTISL